MIDKGTFTNKRLSEVILELEKSPNKDEFQLFGIDFWPIVRLHFFFNITRNNYKNITKPNNNNLQKNNNIKKLVNLGEADLFVTHRNYFINIDGKITDRVLGKIISDSRNPIILDLSDYSFHSDHIGNKIDSIKYQVLSLKVLSYLSPFILFPIFIFFFSKIRVLNKSFKEKHFNFKYALELVRKIFFVYYLSLYSSRLFKQYNIKSIYQSMYYDNFGLGSTLAADNLGITSHCVQHGGQSRNNPIFGKWSNIPVYGYQFLPDIFLCWDDISTESINEWAKNTEKHETKIIGYGWIETWKNSKYKNNIETKKNELLTILVTLQPSVDFLRSFLFEFIKNNHDGISWLLRVHPRQNNQEYIVALREEFSGVSNLTVESSETPLPEMLEISDLHLTFFSSSVYEAKYLNVPSIIVDKRGLDYFETLVDHGFATYAEDKNALYETIKNFLE